MTQRAAPLPHGICDACLNSPAATLQHVSGVIVSYCEHHQTGGFIHPGHPNPTWTLFTPISRIEWNERLVEAATTVADNNRQKLS